MLKIFVNTWGNYNENGADGGEWINLPMDQDELKETTTRIANTMQDRDPEWFVNDYEWESMEFGEVSEYSNIWELNKMLEPLGELKDWERREIAAIMEGGGYKLEEAIGKQERGNYIFYDGMTLEDVAYEYVEECGDIPDLLKRYFDYEAFIRDLRFDGYEETEHGVICFN